MNKPSDTVCSPFFPCRTESLAERAVEMLDPFLAQKRLEAGEHLWRQGDEEGVAVYLRRGHVKVYRSLPSGKDLTLYVFEPGTLFGFTPFLSGTPYPASAVAMGPCEVSVAGRSRLLGAIQQRPDIAFLLFRHLNMRLEEAFETIERLSTKGTVPKVAAALVGLLADSQGGAGMRVVELPVTSAELAQSLGLAPETFSRSISNLVKKNVIHRLGKNKFQVLDEKKLREIGGNVVW